MRPSIELAERLKANYRVLRVSSVPTTKSSKLIARMSIVVEWRLIGREARPSTKKTPSPSVNDQTLECQLLSLSD